MRVSRHPHVQRRKGHQGTVEACARLLSLAWRLSEVWLQVVRLPAKRRGDTIQFKGACAFARWQCARQLPLTRRDVAGTQGVRRPHASRVRLPAHRRASPASHARYVHRLSTRELERCAGGLYFFSYPFAYPLNRKLKLARDAAAASDAGGAPASGDESEGERKCVVS